MLEFTNFPPPPGERRRRRRKPVRTPDVPKVKSVSLGPAVSQGAETDQQENLPRPCLKWVSVRRCVLVLCESFKSIYCALYMYMYIDTCTMLLTLWSSFTQCTYMNVYRSLASYPGLSIFFNVARCKIGKTWLIFIV